MRTQKPHVAYKHKKSPLEVLTHKNSNISSDRLRKQVVSHTPLLIAMLRSGGEYSRPWIESPVSWVARELSCSWVELPVSWVARELSEWVEFYNPSHWVSLSEHFSLSISHLFSSAPTGAPSAHGALLWRSCFVIPPTLMTSNDVSPTTVSDLHYRS
jgi:hypothetical protein